MSKPNFPSYRVIKTLLAAEMETSTREITTALEKQDLFLPDYTDALVRRYAEKRWLIRNMQADLDTFGARGVKVAFSFTEINLIVELGKADPVLRDAYEWNY